MPMTLCVALLCGLLAIVPPAEAQRRRTGRIGGLQITAASLEQLRMSGEGVAGGAGRTSVITIRLRFRNAGRTPICAELVGRLSVVEEDRHFRSYAGTGDSWLVKDLEPQKEFERDQVFEVAGTPGALELLVEQASESQACGEPPGGRRRAPPRPIRLSLEDLAEKTRKK